MGKVRPSVLAVLFTDIAVTRKHRTLEPSA
jgi:hypothetical protein